MIFDEIRGNEDVKRALAGMIDSGRIPHAIMLYENDGCGAISLALGFLEKLTGSQKVRKLIHPDIHFIFPVTKGSKVSTDKPTSESYLAYWRELVSGNPYFLESDLNDALGIEGKSSLIAIAEAKFIIDKLSFHSLEGGWKAVVVYLPEKMNAEAANKLLKAIEEPSGKTQFLLVTHSPEKVLPTIYSRCQSIRIMPVTRETLSGGDDYAEDETFFRMLMEALVARDLSSALEVGELLSARTDREKAKSFCKFASDRLRRIFLLQQGLEDLASADGSLSELASKVKKTFPRRALEHLSRANALVERNVNLKILFTDLVDKLYICM